MNIFILSLFSFSSFGAEERLLTHAELYSVENSNPYNLIDKFVALDTTKTEVEAHAEFVRKICNEVLAELKGREIYNEVDSDCISKIKKMRTINDIRLIKELKIAELKLK